MPLHSFELPKEATPGSKKRHNASYQSSMLFKARRTIGFLFAIGILASLSTCVSVIYNLHKAAPPSSGLASTISSSSRSRVQSISTSRDPATDAQQLELISSSSSRSSHSPPGVFNTQHAGIQRYTLWGSTSTSAAVVLHLWIRFICTSDGTTARGFAIAEEVTQQLPFFIDHPLIPYPIAQNLPQLQLQTEDSTGAWNFTQIHVPFLDGQYPNVLHFHAKLPGDATPTRVGVHGWTRSVDVDFPRSSGNGGSCAAGTTQAAASQQLAWRQNGTIWSVVSPGAELSGDVHAFAICEHIIHHKQLNMSGMVAMLEGRTRVELLMKHSCIKRAVEEGLLYLWIWVSVHTHA
jgi:hypothetical protein